VTVTTATGAKTTLRGTRYTYSTVAKGKGAPTITTVRPGSGPVTGGTRVTITGAHLNRVLGVQFGGVNATSFTRVSASKLYAVVPASVLAGPATVTFTSTAGTSAPGHHTMYDYRSAGPPPQPGAPTRLRVRSSHEHVILSWDAPGNARAAGVLGYQVEWSHDRRTGVLVFNGTATSVNLPVLRGGTTTFRARADNAFGPGPWSEPT
jgi:hypothetical protein